MGEVVAGQAGKPEVGDLVQQAPILRQEKLSREFRE